MKPALEEFQIYEPRLADLVPDDGRLLMHLQSNLQKTTEFIKSLPENKLMYRYADRKWTIKEVINHLIEMERIYMYRALCFARNDQTVLPSFDAEHYVLFSNANERSISDLLGELAAIRQSTITFLLGLLKISFYDQEVLVAE